MNIAAALLLGCAVAAAQQPAAGTPALSAPPPAPGSLAAARRELAQKHFAEAKAAFERLLAARDHSTPANQLEARLGLADSELALHEYEAAELDYRQVAAVAPELWIAHKNLVIVEAALGRWGEFDRERAVLAAARARHAPGIETDEADVIDSFQVAGQRWIVRAYDQPAGRSQTLYNFEHFGPDGRVQEYISLENAAAARSAYGVAADTQSAPSAEALNWYTSHGHGTLRTYPNVPTYETLRHAVIRWLRR